LTPRVNPSACVRIDGERSHSYPGTTICGTGGSTTAGALQLLAPVVLKLPGHYNWWHRWFYNCRDTTIGGTGGSTTAGALQLLAPLVLQLPGHYNWWHRWFYNCRGTTIGGTGGSTTAGALQLVAPVVLQLPGHYRRKIIFLCAE